MGNVYLKKVPFWGKLCACGLCAGFVLSLASGTAGNVMATGGTDSVAGIEQQVKELQEKNEEREAEIESLGDDISENEAAMALVNEQIDGITGEIQKYGELITAKQDNITVKEAEINAVELSIGDKEQEIDAKKEEIAALRVKNKENLERFAKLARAMYINDTSDKIPLLSGSDDWYDYFVYSDVVRNISGQNVEFMNMLTESINKQQQLIEDINSEVASLEQDKADLEAQKSELEQEMSELDAEKADLESYVDEKRGYLYGLASENEDLQYKVDCLKYAKEEDQAAIEQLNAELEELIRAAQSTVRIAYTDGFIWPLSSSFKYITTYFGYDPWRGGNHRGIDVGNAGIGGSNIYAAQSGTVIAVSYTCSHNYGKSYRDACGGGYGNYIIIDHGGGLSTLYAHCGDIQVYQGQQVTQGEVIGHVGSTGWSTGYHLHFEVRENGYAVNPFNYAYKDVY